MSVFSRLGKLLLPEFCLAKNSKQTKLSKLAQVKLDSEKIKAIYSAGCCREIPMQISVEFKGRGEIDFRELAGADVSQCRQITNSSEMLNANFEKLFKDKKEFIFSLKNTEHQNSYEAWLGDRKSDSVALMEYIHSSQFVKDFGFIPKIPGIELHGWLHKNPDKIPSELKNSYRGGCLYPGAVVIYCNQNYLIERNHRRIILGGWWCRYRNRSAAWEWVSNRLECPVYLDECDTAIVFRS